MRKTILWALTCLFTGCLPSRQVPDSPVASMEYRVDYSSRYPDVHFILRRDADGRYRLTNASHCAPEEGQTVEVPESFAEQVKQIVREEHMLAYKESYHSRRNIICGGMAWRFSIAFEHSDAGVSSSGYMKHPKGEGLARIEQLCQSVWE